MILRRMNLYYERKTGHQKELWNKSPLFTGTCYAETLISGGLLTREATENKLQLACARGQIRPDGWVIDPISLARQRDPTISKVEWMAADAIIPASAKLVVAVLRKGEKTHMVEVKPVDNILEIVFDSYEDSLAAQEYQIDSFRVFS